MMADQQEKIEVTTSEGRLLFGSLFVKDQFDEKATAGYKVEMAFGVDDLGSVEDALKEAAVAKWGAGAADEYFDGKIIDPIHDGDAMARRREEAGKDGSFYAGQLVIRAHTIYNLDGNDAPGGIAVFGPDAKAIEPAAQHSVYNGCYGIAHLTIDTYIDSGTQKRALMFYLCAFQKTRDGEPLVAQRDYSQVFKPVGGGAPEGGRRKARG